MNMREQMNAAWAKYVLRRGPEGNERAPFEAGFQAALDRIRNPSDEMVERCAAALDHPSLYMGGPSEQSKRKARACLAAAVGDTTQ